MQQMCFIPSDYVVPYYPVKGILFSNLNLNLDIPLKVYPQLLNSIPFIFGFSF